MAETNYPSSTPGTAWRDTSASVADTTTDIASQAVNHVSDVASRAQQRMTEYFRDHDAKAIYNDLRSYVKAHPAQALIGAAAVGLVAAAILRRR